MHETGSPGQRNLNLEIESEFHKSVVLQRHVFPLLVIETQQMVIDTNATHLETNAARSTTVLVGQPSVFNEIRGAGVSFLVALFETSSLPCFFEWSKKCNSFRVKIIL